MPMENSRQLKSQKIYYQTDLFSGDSEISAIRQEFGSLRSTLDKLRKGLFRRFDELSKLVMSLILRQDDRDLEMAKMKERLDKLEQELLKNSKTDNNIRTLHIVGKRRGTNPLPSLFQ